MADSKRTEMGKKKTSNFELSKRQATILRLVEEDGYISIEELVSKFDVTAQTIRRDVNDLSDRALVDRIHGGISVRRMENTPYAMRRKSFSASKRLMGNAVADLIPDGATLFVNIGTTTEAVAAALLSKRDLHVVTNSLYVGHILAENDTFQIVIAGGELRNKDRGIVGHMTTEFISQFRMDYAVIGVSGISADGSLLDFDTRETQTAKLIIEHATKVILVADQSKFGRQAVVRFATLDDVDFLVTNAPPPVQIDRAIQSANLSLTVTHQEVQDHEG